MLYLVLRRQGELKLGVITTCNLNPPNNLSHQLHIDVKQPGEEDGPQDAIFQDPADQKPQE